MSQSMPLPQASAEHAALRQELEAAYRAIHQGKRELSAITQHGDARIARAADELTAVVADTENATQKVLGIVELIDEDAKTLSAALKNEHNQALAQDIQENVTRIYEVCNFQDLTGQRVANALAALRLIETQIARTLDMLEGSKGHGAAVHHAESRNDLLNGPKLDGDAGHATQGDIDRLLSEIPV